jgi:periplasmic protein TonB
MNPPVSGTNQSGIIQSPLSCWWKIPDKNITVFLTMEIIERINDEIKIAARNPTQNKEVGGLLLGNIDFDPAPKIIVTQCLPVFCKHEFGPAHLLSDSDKKHFRKQIDQCRSASGEIQYILSYYRSNNRPYFQLAEEDLALAREFIPDLFFFLLIQPSIPMNIGGLFFSARTGSQPESKLLFPFDKDRLLSGQTILTDLQNGDSEASPRMIPKAPAAKQLPLDTPGMPNQARQPRPQLPVNPMPAPAPPLWVAVKRSKSPWLWISLVGFLALSLAGITYMRMRASQVSDTQNEMETEAEPNFDAYVQSGLGLETQVENNQLNVKWNKTFPSILSAKKGILSVWNGVSTDTLTLTAQELLRGNVSLPYTSDRVTVHLLLISEEESASGSTGTEASASSTASATASTEPAGYPSSELARGKQTLQRDAVSSSSPNSASIPRSSPPVADLQPQPLSKPKEAAIIAAKGETSINPISTSRPETPSPASAIPDTGIESQAGDEEEQNEGIQPPLSTGKTNAIQTLTTLSVPASEPLQAASTEKAMNSIPQSVPTIAKTADSAPSPGLSNSSPEKSESENASVPPRPVDAVKPIVLPANLTSRLSKSTMVSIRVYIDAAGAVIGAKSLSNDTQLSSLAMDAVKKMRFVPARRGGQNIASELVLNMEFAKNEQKRN